MTIRQVCRYTVRRPVLQTERFTIWLGHNEGLAEYELIQQKKSAMSVRGRQYVVNFVERVLPQLKADL